MKLLEHLIDAILRVIEIALICAAIYFVTTLILTEQIGRDPIESAALRYEVMYLYEEENKSP